MVGVFGRSLSFPNKNPALPKLPLTHHTRSVSLPTRSHPLLSSLRDQLSGLDAWSSSSPPARLADGLSRLRNALDSLDDALHLPQAQSLLRASPQLSEKLLEDFLRFADAYGIFQSSVLAFKEAQSAVQVAIRKKDESKIASYVKARKRIHKEMRDLTSTVKCVAKCGILRGPDHSPAPDAELAAGILGVVKATASVSLALFNGLASSFSARRSSWSSRLRMLEKTKVDERIEELECTEERLWSLRKMKDEEVREVLRKMEDLEGYVECIESGSERVFRSLISARVSLLNTLTL
ncbi:uncharacterized protein LOC115738698 [Rhodamnia argentea]|uniref:Uncharacterized protein LOC115738698 n=1 Tax=Rhodamnia argentea TaxID=178133 RepID=A0A8B8NXJ7_9MYRT|nr:uncharacterized protein LOC115738698 [Rhodamnia argentea]